MTTTARIIFQGRETVWKRSDGYPAAVTPMLTRYIEDGQPGSFIDYAAAIEQLDYPKTIYTVTPSGVNKTELTWSPSHFPDAVRAEPDFTYTVTEDGRIFGGREY